MSHRRDEGPDDELADRLPDAKTEAVDTNQIRRIVQRNKEAAIPQPDATIATRTPGTAIPATQTEHASLRAGASPEAPLFDRLAALDRVAIERLGQRLSFAFGQNIIQEGDAPDGVHFLLEGRARVVKTSGRAKEAVLATLESGDVFGENAIKGTPRSATVRASGPATTLFLPLAELEQLLRERPHLRGWLESYGDRRRIATLLKDTSVFAELSPPTLEALMERLVTTNVHKGQTIFKEGDPLGPVFIVRSGRLKVTRQGGDGKELTIAYLRDGGVFGASSCFEQCPRKATVEALTEVTLLALAPHSFRELCNVSPRFLKSVKAHLAQIDFDREVQMPIDIAELLEGRSEGAPPPARPAADDQPKERAGAKLAPTPEEPFKSEEGYFVKGKGSIKSFPFVYQIDEMDCGAACLAMICRHYGKRVPLGRIRSLTYSSTDGISLGNLINAASEVGLAARSARVSKSNLEKLPLPAIIHWEGNHWVVLFELKKGKAHIADPAIGVRWIPREALDQSWNGFAALFDYTDAFLDNIEEKRGLGWVLPFLRPFKGVLLASGLLAAVVAGLTMVVPIFTQVIVDRIVVGGAVDALLGLIIALGVTFLFLILSRVLQGYLLAFVAVRVDAAIFDFLTRKLLALPMPYFLGRRTGDIQQRLDGARGLRQLVVQGGVNGTLALVQLTAALSIMAVYSPLLTGVFLAVVPLYFGLMIISARVLRPVFGKVEEAFGRYRSDQLDAIKGIESVKVSSAEAQFRDGLLDRFLSMSKEQFKADYTVLTYQGLLQAVGYLSTVLFLWAGAQLAIQGTLTLGGFVAFSSLVALANQPLMILLDLWDQGQRGRALLDRLYDVLGYEPEQGRDRTRLIPVRTLSSGIELRGVGFRYGGPESPMILRSLDLTVRPGETIAMVGRSGSGKTTLAKLIAGLLEPTEGSILFDGVDQRLLNYRDLRRHIGYVLQETHTFAGTILDNIAFGDEPNMEQAISAGKNAAAHEFIAKMPLGYATRVGETGIRLSGGQAQRVAIARALYKNPSIFVFDEATSALDTESERLIQNNLESYLVGRTAFIIAHRLSTVRNATRIVVLEAGEIVEVGSHEELMKRRGIYHELVSRQIEQ